MTDIDMAADLQTGDGDSESDEVNFLSFVNAMVCPQDRPYVVLGGHFNFVERVKSESVHGLSKGPKLPTFDDLYMNVSSIVLFDVENNKFVPIERRYVANGTAQVSTGLSSGTSAVLAMSCENERRCDRIYVGGLFSLLGLMLAV